MPQSQLIIFDFETSGMKPSDGARVIEIGAVRLQNGVVGERFQSLVDPGLPVSPFITALTGITNEMLAAAPKSREVFPAFHAFLGDAPIAAHNVRFDRSFLLFELGRLGLECGNPHACTLLAARRIVPEAPRYQLSVLAEHCGITPNGNWHRALADAEATARLWLYMERRLQKDYGLLETSFPLMLQLTRLRRGKQVQAWLRHEAQRQQQGALFRKIHPGFTI